MNRYSVGERVTWKSQSNASMTEKRGEVVAIVPAGKYTADFIPTSWGEVWNLSTVDGGSMPRNHESYLVLVRPERGNAKPRLYWPRVSALTRGMEPEALRLLEEATI